MLPQAQPTHTPRPAAAAARGMPTLPQPCRMHAVHRAAPLALSIRPIQLEQQQPCSSEGLPHSSSCGRGDPRPHLQPHHVQQEQQQQQPVQQPSLSSHLPLLPLVAAHQLWMTVHSPAAHALESIPPEALALFREFLVGDAPCMEGQRRMDTLSHSACYPVLIMASLVDNLPRQGVLAAAAITSNSKSSERG